MKRSLFAALATSFVCAVSQAAIFHISPIIGSMQNDGSFASPWSTLAEVLDANLIETRSYLPLPYMEGVSQLNPKNVGAPVQPGDTLLLYDGLHGVAFFRGGFNAEPITIMAAPGQVPILSRFQLQAGARWRLIGLHISPEPYGTYHATHLIHFETHNWHGPVREIEVRDCNVYTSANTSAWSAEDWVTRASSGIRYFGHHGLIQNNTFTNVDFGVMVTGDSTEAIGNSIINFSGDGMRAIGNDLLFEGNLIKNCYAVDANHDDGIQSFATPDAPLTRVVLRGNTIINYDDPNQPLLGPLQGIGCFDGPFSDWVVENNVVIVNHWHGISLYGAINCTVANNTVIDPTPSATPGPSWIRINDDTDIGQASSGCVVANNIANTYAVTGTTLVSNLTLSGANYDLHFVDAAGYDLHLVPSSTAIDAADDNYAPLVDHDGLPRPFGAQSDIGAYEFSGTTSIASANSTSFSVYPNPVADRLYVSLPNGASATTLEVLDQLGRTVMIRRIVDRDWLDVYALPSGMYIVRVNDLIALFTRE
ncbi:MAG: T9SS type A sorting domain-containing protein [Flavobacteriales bacterium]|nr:T9SS type A sorting domain-containing protein [Flavobacteriales bacterium]